MTHAHTLTLAEANALLAAINYREDWSNAELNEAVSKLPPDIQPLMPDALRICGETCFAEAEALRRDGRLRGLDGAAND